MFLSCYIHIILKYTSLKIKYSLDINKGDNNDNG